MKPAIHLVRFLPAAIVDILKSLLQLKHWLSLPDSPGQVFDISEDFVGVNVAPAEDPAVDDYI
ncbi:MAG: hypothetical protein IMF06_04535, partial [Proteobacteria bacterium]|nr:hypothetical protein [Pseudomonadota bacterium]